MGKKIAVIGAGVVGLTTASMLANNEHNVHVFEKEAAAGLGTTQSCIGGFLYATQGLSYPKHEELIRLSANEWLAFQQQNNIPNSIFKTNAFMRVSYNYADMFAAEQLANYAAQYTDVEILESARVHKLEPSIAKNSLGAIVVENEKSIHTVKLVAFMKDSLAVNNNVTLNFNSQIQSVQHNNFSNRTDVSLKDSSQDFDNVVIAAGPHAPEQLIDSEAMNNENLSHGISAFLPKEYLPENFELNHHILTVNGSDIGYIAPVEGGIMVGATKRGGDIQSLPTAEHISELKRGVIKLCPSLEPAFENAVIYQGLRDNRAPFCRQIEKTGIIILGGVGGAGTTMATGFGRLVLDTI